MILISFGWDTCIISRLSKEEELKLQSVQEYRLRNSAYFLTQMTIGKFSFEVISINSRVTLYGPH